MKEKTNKANNLQIGRIYINAISGEPCRLVGIIPSQGVWLETYDGYFSPREVVLFEDVHYASDDEVQDFLEDVRAYDNNTLQKV
jgi:hypothetical protein